MSSLRVAQFSVHGFRNLSSVRVAPDPRANLFVGANGQGKTSLLEAVDYVATLRSFRGANRAQLVGHEVARAEIAVHVLGRKAPQHRVERVQVAVDVGDDPDARHLAALRATMDARRHAACHSAPRTNGIGSSREKPE